MDEQLVLAGLAATPIITALVAVAGALMPMVPRRAYPAMAVAIGIAWQCGVLAARGEWTPLAPLGGIVLGLAASGLYSGAIKPALRMHEGGIDAAHSLVP